MSSSSNNRQWIGLTATATLAAATSYWFYQKVTEYGWDGTMRYIWVGDPYSPTIRGYVETLDQVEETRKSQERLIGIIEEALERARLDSVDDDSYKTKTTKEMVKLWMANLVPRNLEQSLAQLDTTLDRLAAQVDRIVISAEEEASTNSRVMQDIKSRKRLLSKQLVLAMERTDALLASYQVLQET